MERERSAEGLQKLVDRTEEEVTTEASSTIPEVESAKGEETQRPPAVPWVGLSPQGKVLVWVAIVCWLGLFLGGIIIDTRPARMAISEPGLIEAIGEDAAGDVQPFEGSIYQAAIIAFLFFTPTNLAILTLMAGLLGTLGRKASLYSVPKGKEESDPTNPKLSAFLRSYLVYLFFLSGVMVFADSPFATPTPASYLRLAGLMSLFSFVANYRPSFFARILEDIHNYVDSRRRREDPQEGRA